MYEALSIVVKTLGDQIDRLAITMEKMIEVDQRLADVVIDLRGRVEELEKLQ